MDKLILRPWLEKPIARYSPKGELGRPPYWLSAMLRVHSMELFYNLSAPSMEDALYEVESIRQFAGSIAGRNDGPQVSFFPRTARPLGVDDKLDLTHRIDTMAANKLFHGKEQRVFGDVGYLGIKKREEHKHRGDVSWYLAKLPGTRKKLEAKQQKVEKITASV